MDETSLPAIRSIVKDARDGKVGQVMDYLPTGAEKPTTAVLRPPGGGLEWRASLDDIAPLPDQHLAPGVGDLVVVKSVSQLCTVILPAHGGSPVQPCSGVRCDLPSVFVQSVAGGDPWWADLADMEIVKSAEPAGDTA
jgi:hypothetical protein